MEKPALGGGRGGGFDDEIGSASPSGRASKDLQLDRDASEQCEDDAGCDQVDRALDGRAANKTDQVQLLAVADMHLARRVADGRQRALRDFHRGRVRVTGTRWNGYRFFGLRERKREEA